MQGVWSEMDFCQVQSSSYIVSSLPPLLFVNKPFLCAEYPLNPVFCLAMESIGHSWSGGQRSLLNSLISHIFLQVFWK